MPIRWETRVQSLGREDLLEKGMATHSSILASPQKRGSKKYLGDFPGGSDGKASAYKAEDLGSIPGSGRSSGEDEMATHSSTLAWKIPWMEEPGRLQSMGLQRVRHDWAPSLSFFLSLYMSSSNFSNYLDPTWGNVWALENLNSIHMEELTSSLRFVWFQNSNSHISPKNGEDEEWGNERSQEVRKQCR